jgi:biopolymer transport protein TolQ
MSPDLSVWHLVTNASFVVQLVMLLLLLASVTSWTLMVMKWRLLRDARSEATRFEERFWSGTDLASIYEASRRKQPLTGLERIFVSGFGEFVRLHRQRQANPLTINDTVQRSMRVASAREEDGLEQYLSFLATVGSTSPYVGLFGTVWGIMSAFMSLSGVHQATLAVVAPGIAEALIATAMGLVAAIPAVIAYNRFADDVERLVGRYENFLEEFLTLLQRQSLSSAEAAEMAGS